LRKARHPANASCADIFCLACSLAVRRSRRADEHTTADYWMPERLSNVGPLTSFSQAEPPTRQADIKRLIRSGRSGSRRGGLPVASKTAPAMVEAANALAGWLLIVTALSSKVTSCIPGQGTDIGVLTLRTSRGRQIADRRPEIHLETGYIATASQRSRWRRTARWLVFACRLRQDRRDRQFL
jgi:hypothetical protein